MKKYNDISNAIYTVIYLWLGWIGKGCYDDHNYFNIICVLVIISAIYFLKEIIDNYFHEVEKLANNNDTSKWCNGWKNLNNMSASYDRVKLKPKWQIVVFFIVIVTSTMILLNCKQVPLQPEENCISLVYQAGKLI